MPQTERSTEKDPKSLPEGTSGLTCISIVCTEEIKIMDWVKEKVQYNCDSVDSGCIIFV